MSAELKDFRGKLTSRSACALEAVSRATGRDQSEIVRELVDKWAEEQIHAASVMHRLLQAEGLAGIAEGTSGNLREIKGTRGKGAA